MMRIGDVCIIRKSFVLMGCLLLSCYAINRFFEIPFLSFPLSFDRYVVNVMKDWHVPGLALVIVNGDNVAYIKGYGVLQDGGSDFVDENTIFAIGSCTKAFTAAALGILVDEGLLKWDDKAHAYLPDLQLTDACVTKELNIKDLLSHRVGLEEAGMLWDHTTLSRYELIKRIRFLKPVEKFREGWIYNNLLYLAAGEIVHAITDITWDDFISQRIFETLGMERSSTTINALKDEINIAVPHYIMDGQVHPIVRHNIDSIAPAGGINSTIKDMACWLKMLINKGMGEHGRLLSEETATEIYSAQSIVKRTYPFQLYGLGFGMFDYQNNEVVFHEGNIDGMSAAIAFVPAKKFGIVILANMHRSGIGKVLMNTILDKYLPVFFTTNWNKKFLVQEEERVKAVMVKEDQKKSSFSLEDHMTYEPSQYRGTYHNNVYGDMVITQDKNDLMCRFLVFNELLKHVGNDTFTLDPSQQNPLFPSQFYFTFDSDTNGVKSVNIEYEDMWENSMNATFIKR